MVRRGQPPGAEAVGRPQRGKAAPRLQDPCSQTQWPLTGPQSLPLGGLVTRLSTCIQEGHGVPKVPCFPWAPGPLQARPGNMLSLVRACAGPFGKKGNENTRRKWLPTRQCHTCPGHGRWQWGQRGQWAPGCSSLGPPALSQPDPRTHTETARWAAEQSGQGVSGQHFQSPCPWASRPPVQQGPPQSPRSRWCCL